MPVAPGNAINEMDKADNEQYQDDKGKAGQKCFHWCTILTCPFDPLPGQLLGACVTTAGPIPPGGG
jgi:hypothetical protein